MDLFKKFGFNENILNALGDLGFEKPSPIQESTFAQIMDSEQDLIGMAQTGTGKTAAFSLPILHKLDQKTKKPQAIVLSPTRELGLQIADNIEKYSKYLDKVSTVAVYGGADIEKQMRNLKKGAHIVVGTPGRTLDLIKRNALDLSEVRWVVLDEADEMLSMGFKDDLDAILGVTPQTKQTLLFSATMPKEARMLANKYMKDAAEIKVTPVDNIGNKKIVHKYYVVQPRDRYTALKRLVDYSPEIYGIIFCRTKNETKDIADHLMRDGYSADAIHGDLSQAQRDYVMQRFRSRSLQILVATDVAARGIDVNDLTHVINYNLPDDDEVYVHRSGRTGRAGKEGISAIIITNREIGKIRSIERKVGKMLKENIPSGKEICKNQLFSLMNTIHEVEINHQEIDPYLPDIYEKFKDVSREDLIQRLVSVEFNKFLEYYKDSRDINAKDNGERGTERNGRERGGSRAGFTRFFINHGRKNRFSPKDLLVLVNENTQSKNIEIGSIDILDAFSFFEAESSFKDEIIGSLNKSNFRGERVSVEEAQQRSSGSDRRKERNFGRNQAGYSKPKSFERRKRFGK